MNPCDKNTFNMALICIISNSNTNYHRITLSKIYNMIATTTKYQ